MVASGQAADILGNAGGDDARVARDVEQSSRRVVVVTDEVQVAVVRALDAVAPQRESLRVDAGQLPERRERGAVARSENDDVEWQLGRHLSSANTAPVRVSRSIPPRTFTRPARIASTR